MWFDKVNLRQLLMIMEEKYPHALTEEELREKAKKMSIRPEDLDRYLYFCLERAFIIVGENTESHGSSFYPIRITHQGIAFIHDLR
jgi:hypothetical protein